MVAGRGARSFGELIMKLGALAYTLLMLSSAGVLAATLPQAVASSRWMRR